MMNYEWEFQHLGYQAKAKFQCKALGQLHGCFSAKTQWLMDCVPQLNFNCPKKMCCKSVRKRRKLPRPQRADYLLEIEEGCWENWLMGRRQTWIPTVLSDNLSRHRVVADEPERNRVGRILSPVNVNAKRLVKPKVKPRKSFKMTSKSPSIRFDNSQW